MALPHRRRLRPATQEQHVDLKEAVSALRTARDRMRGADCPNALRKIRGALKSAEGAERHMRRRLVVRS